MISSFEREEEMYRPIKRWFFKYLSEKYPDHEVKVWDTHSVYLDDFLRRKNISEFAESPTFRMKIDITGIIFTEPTSLAFIECKNTRIDLKDLSQLIGYSKVAKPLHSFLISSKGFTDCISKLFLTYNREDVLEYYPSKKIILFKWNKNRGADYSSVIPRGFL